MALQSADYLVRFVTAHPRDMPLHASAHRGAPPPQVRFVSAHPKDVHATFGVQLAALRPGWLHKNGRWAGHWQPKVKSKRMLEREAHFEKVKLAWPVGMHVEVEQTDGSLQGSVFEGEVVGHEFDSKAIVRYFELHEGEDDTEELPLKPKALRERDEKTYTAPKTKKDPKASKVR